MKGDKAKTFFAVVITAAAMIRMISTKANRKKDYESLVAVQTPVQRHSQQHKSWKGKLFKTQPDTAEETKSTMRRFKSTKSIFI